MLKEFTLKVLGIYESRYTPNILPSLLFTISNVFFFHSILYKYFSILYLLFLALYKRFVFDIFYGKKEIKVSISVLVFRIYDLLNSLLIISAYSKPFISVLQKYYSIYVRMRSKIYQVTLIYSLQIFILYRIFLGKLFII